MAFQVSPGINVSEIDLTTSIPALSTSTGGIAGAFAWGPVEEIVPVSNETSLVSIFGKPDNDTANVFFTAASFLSYSNDLLVVRATAPDQYNALAYANTTAQAGGTTVYPNILIKNVDKYSSDIYLNGYARANGNVATVAFASRYPGNLGNSLKISLCSGGANAFNTWTYSTYFDSAPGTSAYAAQYSSSNDEMHIVVVDEDGLISGVPGTLLEKYSHVSKASDAKNDDGSTNYYKEVLYKNSQYVYFVNHPTSNAVNTVYWGTSVTPSKNFAANTGDNQAYTASFANGAVGTANVSTVQTAYETFENTENVDVALLITADSMAGNATLQSAIIDIAESRKDALAFISPRLSDALATTASTSISNYRKNTLNRTSSYAVMDSGWKYMYDKYNDLYRWVPLNGDIAGLCARTDSVRDPWFSPAGYQRGVIRNLVKLAYNPDKAGRDTLYKAGVNPVVSFPGEGTVLFGDKTLLSRPSAFDRINVRRLFIVLEKAISRAAKASLFEFNDEFTRAQFVSLVEPFLRTIQGRRGIYDFRVVCDETNNTPDIIDRNEFVGDIYIKPARSINYIQLNFVAVRTGVAFEEIVGQF